MCVCVCVSAIARTSSGHRDRDARSKKASARRKANEVGQQEPPDSSYVKYCLHTACDCLLHRRPKLMRMMAPCPASKEAGSEKG